MRLLVLVMGFRIVPVKSASDSIIEADEELLIVERSWTQGKEFYFIVEYDFEPSYWVIPGVAYNGNNVGRGVFPRPSLDETWFFREDRCCIPSAGIVENEEEVLAVFVEPAKIEDELSAVSVTRGKIIIRIPWVESPRRYAAKNKFARPRKIYFLRDRRYHRRFYIVYSKYPEKGYKRGYYLVIEKAMEILGERKQIQPDIVRKYVERRISFALNVHYCGLARRRGFVQFVLCGTPISGSSVSGGFVGRDMDLALALYRIYLITRNNALRDLAFEIANIHCSGLRRDGLIFTDYFISTGRKYGYALLHRRAINTRIVGEMLYSMLRLYEYARRHREEKKLWLLVPLRVALFFVRNQLDEGGYGSWWTKRGPVEYGTNGAYAIWFITKLYELTGERIFLKSAERAMRYYATKFVERDIYHGDTLDADSIDKEGAHAILRACLLLYEATKNSYYIRLARRAAYFLATWVFLWNIPFRENTFLGKINFKTKGWTTVSVENQHLDPYGLIIAPDLLKLHSITKEEIWRDLAFLMARPVLKFVFPHKHVEINRVFYGYQPEQINHTDWSYIPLFGNLCLLTMFGITQKSKKGSISNMILWTASATVNAALDLAETLGIELSELKIQRPHSKLFELFKALQKIFVSLNIIF